MKCPYCLEGFTPQPIFYPIPYNPPQEKDWRIERIDCPNPACKKIILNLQGTFRNPTDGRILAPRSSEMIFPNRVTSRPIPPDVDDQDVISDYTEACLVFDLSPKASAALSRRCLQHILRTKAGVNHYNLADAIKAVIASNTLPSHLNESIDAVCHIGNFAAHPMKDTATGSVLPVEPGEAEWTLDVLEALFDFYYVQPAILKRKRDDLNAKLAQAGKKPMK